MSEQVALVAVSHSALIAQGVEEMARGMNDAEIPIASCGGVDDPEHPLGSNAMAIVEALQKVMNDAGVVIFYDIGSSKLNAEMARDLLPEEQQQLVHICDAPLVEGMMAASVEVTAGSDVARVMAGAAGEATTESEAGHAEGEGEEASLSDASPTPSSSSSVSDGMMREYLLRNPLGLHGRPAAAFIKIIRQLKATAYVQNCRTQSKYVSATSLVSILKLEMKGGDTIRIVVESDVAEEVHTRLEEFISSGCGEL